MAKFNDEIFAKEEEVRKSAAMECGMYLQSCLTRNELEQAKRDWEALGGSSIIPWWKYCFDNIKVSYEGKERNMGEVKLYPSHQEIKPMNSHLVPGNVEFKPQSGEICFMDEVAERFYPEKEDNNERV